MLMVLGIPGLTVAADNVVSTRLAKVIAESAEPSPGENGTYGIWVKFSDRNVSGAELAARLDEARSLLTEHTLNRRAKAVRFGEDVVTEGDLSVAREYLDAVAATGAEFRRESRWLNAASFNATAEQIAAIENLPFVVGLDLVAQFTKRPVVLSDDDLAAIEQARADASADKNIKWSLDYGGSLEQAEMINVPPVHEMKLTGHGVIIGVMDTGFEFDHESMQLVDVIAAYDFINNDSDVSDGVLDPEGQAQHGTETLSLLAGFKEGSLIGMAHKASFILAKTEELDRETPQEEDNFIAALEWMEGMGVDVVSSHVGYVDWYNFNDLDGMTASITIACDMASSLGVCVVTAAGNLNGEIGLPPLMAPADGRHVITVGSVSLDGVVASSSSRGPTFDGRIKPDVMALGFGPVVGSWYADWVYPNVSGTSYATAQVAGVVALMLEANPGLNPWEVREALRTTGSRANFPDNDYGWGIIDAKAAVNFWGPYIEHETLGYTDQASTPRTVTARVTSRQEMDAQGVVLSWRFNLGPWQRELMAANAGNLFTGEIPAALSGSYVEYYIEATDMGGTTLAHPWGGSSSPHFYGVGSDGIAPTLFHTYLMDQRLVDWPPIVRANATDNVGVSAVELTFSVDGGMEQGPFPLDFNGDQYEMPFPLDPAGLSVGDLVSYQLTARDESTNGNLTVAGPFDFNIVAERARVLVIDDLSENKSLEKDNGSTGHGGVQTFSDKASFAPVLIAGWLTDAGYQVDIIQSSRVKEGTFLGYQAVVLSSGQSFYPVTLDELRAELINYVEGGGRLLVEGGETGYICGVNPGHPEFLEKVLHTSEVLGEGGYLLHPTMGMEDHAFLHRPNRMPDTLWMGLLPGAIDYRVSDMVQPTSDSGLVYSNSFTSQSGGILFHDDNTGPDQGQVVYFPLAINFIKDAVGRMMVENAMAYLLTEELPGRSSITGQVLLTGAGDHSGIIVSTDSLHTTVTDAGGNYTLDGLWGGNVVLRASFPGYGLESLDILLVDDQIYPAETLTLTQTTVLEYENATVIQIPDNDPAGVDSIIDVPVGGTLHSLRVNVNISHYSINNLIVTLTSPAGTQVTLHNRSGGTADDIVGSWPDLLTVDGPGSLGDLLGEDVRGTWTFHVSDNQLGAMGSINSWGLTMEVTASDPSSVGGKPAQITRLLGNSPNPFNPRTVISFDLARTGPVRLNIYDLRGRLVRGLVASDLTAGRHDVVWDGLDRQGKMSASGVYFTKLQADGTSKVNKMTLVR